MTPLLPQKQEIFLHTLEEPLEEKPYCKNLNEIEADRVKEATGMTFMTAVMY